MTTADRTVRRNALPGDTAPATPKAPAAASAARRRTQAERRGEAEQRLLGAALEIVSRRGSERMTLAEVGEAAGYSRGLPAHRFGSKDGLLRALAAHIGELFAAQLAATAPTAPGLDAIRGHVRLYFSRSGRGWMTTRAMLIMMAESLKDASVLRDDFAAYNRSARAFFETHIAAGIEAGEIPADADPVTTAAILLGSFRGVMLQALIDKEIDLLRVRDRLLFIVERTLARDPRG